MKTVISIITMGIFSSLFGCKSNSLSNELIEITSNQVEEEGWQDLIFSITEKKLESNIWNLKCEGIHKGLTVGFRIRIMEGLEPGIHNEGLDNTKFVKGGIIIESIGLQSDNLIQALSVLYNQPKSEKFIRDKLTYTIFPLNQDVANLETRRFKFKLFYDDKNEMDLYSEFYVNPDLPNGTLEFNEKDDEYRKNIIQSFTLKQ